MNYHAKCSNAGLKTLLMWGYCKMFFYVPHSCFSFSVRFKLVICGTIYLLSGIFLVNTFKKSEGPLLTLEGHFCSPSRNSFSTLLYAISHNRG